MKIEVTSFRREDGVTLMKTLQGQWMLRSICGPAWFWDTEENNWMIPSREDHDLRDSLRFSLDHGMVLLNTVKRKQ